MATQTELTDKQRTVLDYLPATSSEISDSLGITTDAAYKRLTRIDDEIVYQDDGGVWHCNGDVQEDTNHPDLSGVDVTDDPSPDKLTKREEYIIRELQTGTRLGELSDQLDERESIVTQHLRDLKSDGWQIYIDETADLITLEGDHAIRSSEHKGTRTRKANRWWELRHNELVREFKSLETPTAEQTAARDGEDWVLHLTDVHAGDKVHTADGTNVYNVETIPAIIRYITEKSLELADYHGAPFDTAHLLWGGDFITNEGIYEGQFEDLDAWLDEQHDILCEPLLEQLKAYSDRFETVNVVCQVGNHGNHRASGTSKHANADLILYKNLRNTVAAIRKYGDGDELANVNFQIGEARPYVNFGLRGGKLRGHLRHGQNRSPQASTSARHDKWVTTLMNHEFDMAWMGHHHVSGRIPWDGPPIVSSGSPKPPSDFVDRIAASVNMDPRKAAREIAHCHGVADHGMTGSYPLKTHDFDYLSSSK